MHILVLVAVCAFVLLMIHILQAANHIAAASDRTTNAVNDLKRLTEAKATPLSYWETVELVERSDLSYADGVDLIRRVEAMEDRCRPIDIKELRYELKHGPRHLRSK